MPRTRRAPTSGKGFKWWLFLPFSLFAAVLYGQIYLSSLSLELPSSLHHLLSFSLQGEQQQQSRSSIQDHRHHLPPPPPPSLPHEKKLFYGHVLPGGAQPKIRAPFIVLPRKLGQGMLDYFRNLAFFQLDLRQLPEGDESTGFVACVDHPELANHHYWEGCFHGRADVAEALPDIFHPRHQRAFTMPVAPLELRAFMECLRQKLTKEWYGPLVRPRLIALGRKAFEITSGLETLVEILDNGGMFSSLAVQVHYGDAISRRHLHWHTDWANSLLHLGMGVGKGRRGLHRKCALTANTSEEAQDMVEWQEPGDAYVSSPKFFDHGVEFPQIDEWDERVIAVQSRMLFSPEQHQSLLTSRLNENEAFVILWTEMMGALNEVLIELPTNQEVELMVLTISKKKGNEKATKK